MEEEVAKGEHQPTYSQIKKQIDSLPPQQKELYEEAANSGSVSAIFEGTGLENDPEFKNEIFRLETIMKTTKNNLEKQFQALSAKSSDSEIDFEALYKEYPRYKDIIDETKAKAAIAKEIEQSRVYTIDKTAIWNELITEVAAMVGTVNLHSINSSRNSTSKNYLMKIRIFFSISKPKLKRLKSNWMGF